jgi:glycosyltransferase involved in cell wall biosynthesis
VFDALSARRIVSAARDADAVLLVKTDSPALIRELRRSSKARLIYDLADARRYDPRDAALLDDIVAQVDGIAVDNAFAQRYAARFNKPLHLVPPVAYVERFDERRPSSRDRGDGRVVVGWIGTASTASNLYLVLEALEAVSRADPRVELRLVGIPSGHEIFRRFEHVRVTSVDPYDAERMIREVADMDIGLFPQYELEQAGMHGVTKALIYMGGGAAVVASPVGEIPTLVRNGENGLLASDRAGWTAQLTALIADPARRARLAAAGLSEVRANNSLERCFDQLRRALAV